MSHPHPLSHAAPASFAFGPFVLIPERQTLLKHGLPVRLGSRAFDILTVLVGQAGALVSKRDLMAQVWRNTVVDEGALKFHIVMLRRALGDETQAPDYIGTSTGRGYRFMAQVRRGEGHDLAPELFPAPPSRHNLPARAGVMLGREASVQAALDDLAQCRLLTLAGAGGAGKSMVALAVAERGLARFEGGVWHVDLASAVVGGDPAVCPACDGAVDGAGDPMGDAVHAIAVALGTTASTDPRVDTPTAWQSVIQTLLRWGRPALLVLDGCESMIDQVAQLAERLLAGVPHLSLLATSREPLNIDGERVRRLQGLALPPTGAALTAEQALSYTAVALFATRARSGAESFELTDANAQDVVDLCARLDGLPLGIDLAAAQLAELGLTGLLDQVEGGLGAGLCRRAGPARHRSLAANVAWSHRLLSETEAVTLRAVAGFDGAFSLSQAMSQRGFPARCGAQALSGLVRKSMATVCHDRADISYRLLRMTRDYCRPGGAPRPVGPAGPALAPVAAP